MSYFPKCPPDDVAAERKNFETQKALLDARITLLEERLNRAELTCRETMDLARAMAFAAQSAGVVTHGVLVTGAREWADVDVIGARLRRYPRSTVVIHGDCGGADAIAHRVAEALHMTPVPVPYFRWLGLRGGPERNRVMLEMLLAYERRGVHICVEAFPLGGPGTAGMMRLARGAGVKVHEWFTEGTP
jgi:hypothetical protein